MQKALTDWKENQLTVALRIRPLSKDEKNAGATGIAQTVDDQIVVLMDPAEDPDDVLRRKRSREKHFCFDKVFGPQCPQEEVYANTTKVLMSSVTNGFNATVFAYGATGAGKTYTMLGTDEEPGIMARALNDLFQEMERTSEDNIYKVSMSYLEIYNEMIRDLLSPSTGYLDLREHASGAVQVAGISEVSTNSSTEVMNLLIRGNKERTQEPTAANKTSSRSHAVLQVTVRQRDRVRGINQSMRTGKLFMIDLAGSERASQTKNRGKRMIEGAHINRSLLALGNCINALCEGGKYVNYRDSKLTRLLKDSLGGNCKTVMIANISPASFFFEESRNTLLYADRAKNIKMKIKSNTTSVSYHVAQYTNIIAELKQEINRLQQKIAAHEEERGIGKNLSIDAASRAEMDRLRQQLMSNFNIQMGIRQELMNVEQETWHLSLEANKQLSVIAEWEQDQLRLQSKNKPKLNLTLKEMDLREKAEKELDRDADAKSTTSESPEPEDVTDARQQLSIILRQRADCYNKRSDLEEQLEAVRKKGSIMEENLPNKTTSDEQREILSMLCKVHELEIETPPPDTELKSEALVNTHVMELKDVVTAKMKSQRELCDKIIHQQKELLEENHVLYTEELEELYELYQSTVMEERAAWNQDLNLPNVEGIKGSSMLSIRPSKSLDEEDEELSEDDDKDRGTEKYDSRKMTKKSSDTYIKTDNSRVFNPSPRSWQLRERMEKVANVPHVRVHSPSLTRHGSLASLGERRNRAASPSSGAGGFLHPLSPEVSSSSKNQKENRQEIIIQTKSIAAKAARKKTTGHHYDRRKTFDKTPASLHSLQEVDEVEEEYEPSSYLTPSRLSRHHVRSNSRSSQMASRLSDLEEVGSASGKDKKAEGADKRVNYWGGVKKIHISNRQVMQQKMKRRGNIEASQEEVLPFQRKYSTLGNVSVGESKQSIKKLSRPVVIGNSDFTKPSRLKYPINHHTGDTTVLPVTGPGEQNIVTLDSRSSPTAKVHQLGAEKGKGQTVQRRVRGPNAFDSPNNSFISHKAGHAPRTSGVPVSIRSRQGNLQVSGHTVLRKGNSGRT